MALYIKLKGRGSVTVRELCVDAKKVKKTRVQYIYADEGREAYTSAWAVSFIQALDYNIHAKKRKGP